MPTHVTCPRCEGTGYVRATTGAPCSGERYVETPCPVCRGKGEASHAEKMGAPPRHLRSVPRP